MFWSFKNKTIKYLGSFDPSVRGLRVYRSLVIAMERYDKEDIKKPR